MGIRLRWVRREPRAVRWVSRDPWPSAVAAFEELFEAVCDLESDHPATVERLARALHWGSKQSEQTEALFILRFLDVDYTASFVDELVSMTLSGRHARRACETLARLGHADAARLVPPAVWRQLEHEGEDDFVYREFAGLLDYLGLTAAFDELRERGLASDDPDIREVFEDDLC